MSDRVRRVLGRRAAADLEAALGGGFVPDWGNTDWAEIPAPFADGVVNLRPDWQVGNTVAVAPFPAADGWRLVRISGNLFGDAASLWSELALEADIYRLDRLRLWNEHRADLILSGLIPPGMGFTITGDVYGENATCWITEIAIVPAL